MNAQTITQATQVTSQNFIKTDLQAKLDPVVFESIVDWSDNEILIAL